MRVAGRVEDLIGSTPLVDLTSLGCGDARILGKWEAVNPGGSAKDRVARAMLDAAERDGALAPGATVIEPTSGNTGIALAMLAAERGYRMVLVMPDTMSVERRRLAESYGAEVVLTPGSEGMAGAVRRAEELREATPGAFVPGQFSNPANPRAHFETTGPEIWADTDGRVTALVAGVGTGGTVSGAGRYLKGMSSGVRIVAVEPAESQVLSGGVLGPHGIQGIGAGFVPETLDRSVVDEVMPVSTQAALAMRGRLARMGLLVGVSSGAAAAAAVVLAGRRELAGGVIVVVLPDTGERYLSLGA